MTSTAYRDDGNLSLPNAKVASSVDILPYPEFGIDLKSLTIGGIPLPDATLETVVSRSRNLEKLTMLKISGISILGLGNLITQLAVKAGGKLSLLEIRNNASRLPSVHQTGSEGGFDG